MLCLECTPSCDGRQCGKDPKCGKSCGTCATGELCQEGSGQCVAHSQGRQAPEPSGLWRQRRPARSSSKLLRARKHLGIGRRRRPGSAQVASNNPGGDAGTSDGSSGLKIAGVVRRARSTRANRDRPSTCVFLAHSPVGHVIGRDLASDRKPARTRSGVRKDCPSCRGRPPRGPMTLPPPRTKPSSRERESSRRCSDQTRATLIGRTATSPGPLSRPSKACTVWNRYSASWFPSSPAPASPTSSSPRRRSRTAV